MTAALLAAFQPDGRRCLEMNLIPQREGPTAPEGEPGAAGAVRFAAAGDAARRFPARPS